MDLQQQTIRGAGVELNYRSLGEGPPALLIHGWMMTGEVWDHVAPLLEGRRVIIPDLRGAGQSDKPGSGEYTMEHYGNDLRAIIEGIGGDDWAVIGHSMGGQLAQWVAAHEPERVKHLVGVCPVPASGLPLPDDAVGLFSTSGGNRESQKIILDMACLTASPEQIDSLLDVAAKVDTTCVGESFGTWTSGGFADKLSNIKAKTLVIGTSDPFLTPEVLQPAIVEKIDGARFEHIEGPGHYAPVEAPNEVASAIVSFLNG